MKEKVGKARIVDEHAIHEGFARFFIATVQLPDGRNIRREIEDHGQAVCILPYNPSRKTAVLVRQLRVPVLFAGGQDETLEAIAGGIEEEDAIACARREAMEEARLKLDSLEYIVTAWTMPGISTERLHFYLAIYSGEPRGEIHGGEAAEDEDTIAVEIDLAELARMADSRELIDVKTLLLLQTLRLRHPELF
jgi:nudix-type nucleoside diphosphatase (YffH/AdpP family)